MCLNTSGPGGMANDHHVKKISKVGFTEINVYKVFQVFLKSYDNYFQPFRNTTQFVEFVKLS